MAPRHTRGSGHDFDDSLGTDRGHLRGRVAVTVNAELTMLYWGIGRRVREDVLGSEKPEYGRVVVERLAERLTARFGRGYSWSSLFRMMRFAAIYESREILAPLVPILTWSHFLQLIALSDADERARRRAADRPDPVHEQGASADRPARPRPRRDPCRPLHHRVPARRDAAPSRGNRRAVGSGGGVRRGLNPARYAPACMKYRAVLYSMCEPLSHDSRGGALVRDRPMERSEPAYELADVRSAFSEGRFQVTGRVSTHMDRRGWSRSTIGSCVALLSRADFHKSQRHLTRPGAWLGVYKPAFGGERLYVKFTPLEGGECYLVLSFCGDGEEH